MIYSWLLVVLYYTCLSACVCVCVCVCVTVQYQHNFEVHLGTFVNGAQLRRY